MEDDYQIIKGKRSLLSMCAKLFVAVGLGILILTWVNTGAGWGTQPEIKNDNEWSLKSNIGTFVGGTVGSLFSLSGFFLLYLTFQSQKEAFLKERFENKFFELIKLHRENVKEFEIGNKINGRKCFVAMLNEFHYIYKLTSIGYSIDSTTDRHYLDSDPIIRDQAVVDLAFKIFFFGIGFNSEKQLRHFVTDNQFAFYKDFIKERLAFIQQGYLDFRDTKNEGYYEFNPTPFIEKDDLAFETFCYPFDGHSIRLGHYYRQLFQCVKFVDRQDEILSPKDKLFYINTLRAQLSNQEQLLLYYDSLSEFGKAWYDENYFKKYSFLKNIPLALVKVKPHPHDKIGIYNEEGKFLFEWDKPRTTINANIES